MRVSDDRYSRDFRSFHLALWMLRQGARCSTISDWTGIAARRVQRLSTSHRREHPASEFERRRGPPPTQLAKAMTNPILRSELAAIGGLFRVLGVVPEESVPNARRRLPGLTRGERLCSVFELLRQVVPNARLSLDQAVLLVYGLAEGERWSLGSCAYCRATILLDRLSLQPHVCVHCQQDARTGKEFHSELHDARPEDSEVAEVTQPDLFASATDAVSEREQPNECVVECQQEQGAQTDTQQLPERERR